MEGQQDNRQEENCAGEMSGMSGVRGPPSASMTQSMVATPSPSLMADKTTPDLMTTSMNSLSGTPSKSSKRPLSHRNETSQNWFLFENGDENEGRTDVSAAAKEREERVRRLREQQEDERKKKLEELKQHALSSQKFREQQEVERRRHIEDLRSKDQERRNQVEERRKEIEKAESERREALFQRNKEREDRINTQRKNSRSHIDFAFGSSAPRLLEPRIDSGYWGSRSSADRNSAERETDLRNKRTVSAQGLDRSTEDLRWGVQMKEVFQPPEKARSKSRDRQGGSKSHPVSPSREMGSGYYWVVRDINIDGEGTKSEGRATRSSYGGSGRPLQRTRSRHDCSFSRGSPFLAGEEDGLVGGFSSGAHRRRTDLVPTIVMPRGGGGEGGRSGTPSKMTRSPGRAVSMSRIDQLSQPRRYTLHVGQVGQAGRTSPSKSVSMSHLGGGGRVNQTRQHPQLSLLDTNKIRQDNTKRPRSKTTGAKDVTRSRTATGTGISRENTASRPGSAMSGTSAPPRSGGAVRLRSAPSRRPRPTSIATTGMTAGMTASMYEERQKPIHVPRQKLLGTPKADRMKRARSVTSDTGVDDDAKSTTSSIGGSRTPARKTPAQVKAEAAARKAKASKPDEEGNPQTASPKTERSVVKTSGTDISSTRMISTEKGAPKIPKTPVLQRKVGDASKKVDPSSKSPRPALNKTAKSGHSSRPKHEKSPPPASHTSGRKKDGAKKIEISEVDKSNGNPDDIIVNMAEDIIEEVMNQVVGIPSSEEITDNIGNTADIKEDENEKATRQTPSTPKTSTGKREVDKKSPSPALSSENVARSDGDGENQRQITPDIIKDNNKEKESDEKESSPEGENDNSHENRERNIISSEEEAKARIAQKRKEMKEKKEREEELERQRQAEIERLEEERRLREEEEERKMMIEADRLAAEARIAEEERVQKAIEEAELERKRQEEEEEKLKKEKEEVEKKAKEEAEKREIELQEKLKKEEEERLARKKRIEEIMARTRGKNSTPNTTPKKEVEPEAEDHQTPSQPASLNIDPTKPDLLGDINDSVSVAAENAKNIEVSASSSVSENGVAEESKDVVKNGDAEVEKGTIDSMSKADLIVNSNNVDTENSKSPSPSPLIDVEEPPKKPGNAVSEGGAEFDQLIDLGQLQDTNKTDQPEHSPIIAFEDSITSPRQQQNAAELLS